MQSKDSKPRVINTHNVTIVMIGLMGCGKSSIGKKIAKKLKLPFKDSDTEVELAAELSITEIFDQYGEASFRDCERSVISRILNEEKCILATGGGSFIDNQIREQIKQKSLSVWLRADLDTLVSRTSGRKQRPLLNTINPRKVLSDLIKIRYPIYAEADIIVDTNSTNIDKTSEEVIYSINKHKNYSLNI